MIAAELGGDEGGWGTGDSSTHPERRRCRGLNKTRVKFGAHLSPGMPFVRR